MWKVLLVIASVVLAGAAFLSYSNMGAVKVKIAEMEVQKTTLEERTGSLAKTNEEIAQFEQAIQVLKDETATLETTKVDLETKLLEAQANQKAQEANLTTAKTDLEKAKILIQDVVAVEAIQKEMLQVRTQNEEAEIELTQLEGAVASAKVERDRLERVSAELAALRVDQEAGVIRGEFQSQIKKAFNQWGFVVVAGGYDQGVVNRAQLDVYRRGQPICRLLVTSVESDQTVADIVPGSLAPGQKVQVGDTVVKTVSVQTPAVVPAATAGASAAPAPAGTAPVAPGAAPAAPAAADPFGGAAMDPAAAPAPDPFGGGGMAPAPAAAPDPFGSPAPAPAPAPAPDPFGAPPAGAPGTPAPAPGTPAPPAGTAPNPFQ